MAGGLQRFCPQLSHEKRQKLLKKRLNNQCQILNLQLWLKVYKRVLDKPVTEPREAGICMRENDFYIGTVLSFRDRRYEYKGLNKSWKGKLDAAKVIFETS